MRVGDTVRLSDGFLALHPPATAAAKELRGTVNAVHCEFIWDVLTTVRIKVDGQWYLPGMWEVA